MAKKKELTESENFIPKEGLRIFESLLFRQYTFGVKAGGLSFKLDFNSSVRQMADIKFLLTSGADKVTIHKYLKSIRNE